MIPDNTTGPGGAAIVYGQPGNPHVLTVFADLRCPYCKRMENGLGAVMERAADEGRYAVHYRLGTLIDGNVGGSGSLRALAALGAAADSGQRAFAHYMRILYADQPPESDDAFASAETLLRLAGEVEGLRGTGFDKKVSDGVYVPWARRVAASFESLGVPGTPTVLIDGTPIPVLNPRGHAVTPEAFLAELPD